MRKPIAFCTVCHEYTDNVVVINQPHRKTKYGTKCKGVFRSAMQPDDWISCPTCNGTGRLSTTRCDHCDGWGWLLDRK